MVMATIESESLHIRGERLQRFVEIIHLCDSTARYREHEEVRAPMRELVVAGEGELDGNA